MAELDWLFNTPKNPSNYVELPPATGGMSAIMGAMGPVLGVLGGLQAGFGAYFSAQSTKNNLQFQSDMAAINARMAENTAQSIMDAGQKQAGMVSAKYGAAKSATKVSQAARGIQAGEGSAAEEVASIDLAKETDMLTINANAVRQASAARMQSVNAQNESLIKGTTADSISPFAAATSSLISSAAQVAPQWYRLAKGGV